MDIRIGEKVDRTDDDDSANRPSEWMEARILYMRKPRTTAMQAHTIPRERRRRDVQPDPLSARVVMLLIPEGYRLPNDINSGNYRVFLRLQKK